MKGRMIAFPVCWILIILIIPSASLRLSRVQTDNISSSDFKRLGNETEPTYGGTLRIGSWAMPETSLNPLQDKYSSYLPIYNRLTRFDGNASMVPDLAYSWNTSLDGLKYTFHLYNNVTWHDGVPFTSEDVKFTIDTLYADPNNEYIPPQWVNITSVETPTNYSVIINMGQICASFLYYLRATPIVAKHVYEGNLTNTIVVGTGPFKFVEWVQGSNVTLIAYETYFRGRPYLDGLVYHQDLPLQDSLADNLIDIAGCYWEWLDPDVINELEQTPGISKISALTDDICLIGLNLRNPILNNNMVRKALAYSINKTQISEVFRGYIEPGVGPISPGLTFWYNSNVTHYDHNITKAEELLDQAGYPRDPQTGIRFNLTFKAGGYDFLRREVSERIGDCFQEIGVNITLVFLSWEELTEVSFVTYDFDIVGTWRIVNQGYDPDNILWCLYHSTSDLNAWNYSNSRVDELLEQAYFDTVDETERKVWYDEVQEILADELPNIWLYYPIRVTVYNNDFHGFSSKLSVTPVDTYSLEKVWYEPTLSGQGKSPVKICFVDSEGRRTGYFNGTILTEIPESEYLEDRELVKIRSPSGNYTVELYGTGNGTYSLEVVNVALDYKNMYLPIGTIREGQTRRYLVTIYSDGSISTTNCAADLDGDSDVDIYDVVIMCNAYGSQPGYQNWNIAVDIAPPIDTVDIYDIVALVAEYGKEW